MAPEIAARAGEIEEGRRVAAPVGQHYALDTEIARELFASSTQRQHMSRCFMSGMTNGGVKKGSTRMEPRKVPRLFASAGVCSARPKSRAPSR